MNKLVLVPLAALGLTLSYLPAAPADGPSPVKPINLPFNTAADEDDPFVAGNGLVLYYAANGKGKFDVMISKRTTRRQKWGAGEIPEDDIQTPADDRSPCATAEGRYPQYLYYATRKDKETDNFDIYVAVKQGRGKAFTEPTPVQAVDTEADELHPWLTADGKGLYFSRKTKEGFCVFVATRTAATGAGGFREPKLLDELPPGFHHATLTADGRTMYLQGPLDKGRTGLFVSTRTGPRWGKPQPLEMLNNPEGATGDRSPSLSRDGTLLYFASDRPGGKGGLDIWVVPTAQLKAKK